MAGLRTRRWEEWCFLGVVGERLFRYVRTQCGIEFRGELARCFPVWLPLPAVSTNERQCDEASRHVSIALGVSPDFEESGLEIPAIAWGIKNGISSWRELSFVKIRPESLECEGCVLQAGRSKLPSLYLSQTSGYIEV